MRHRHDGMLADRRERKGSFPDKEVRPNKRDKGAHADALRYRTLRLPAPQGLLLRTGVCRNARSATYIQGGAGDVPQNGVQCRGAQSKRSHEEHLFPDGQRRKMADVDKRQIQRHHQRRPARMRSQEQHQECRTDYRRGLPGGIRMAGDRPGVRSAAKDDRGDPTEYDFLLIVWFYRLLQLYFIPVFIYTFIKVKSK